MAGETTIHMQGWLTSDPELRFLPQGSPVVNFTIASTPRSFDKASNEWKDGETLFMRCSMWGTGAENVAESLRKGFPVLAIGDLVSRSWEQDGNKRTVTELKVTAVGLNLTMRSFDARTVVNSTPKSQGGGGFQQSSPSAASSPMGGDPNDPWGAHGAAADEPPF